MNEEFRSTQTTREIKGGGSLTLSNRIDWSPLLDAEEISDDMEEL
jgi:hypothetical protein